jgi:hypothetical protein
MEKEPAVVSRILGGPAERPEEPICTSFVGVKMSLVSRGVREISVRFPTTVAEKEFNAKAQRSKGAKNFNRGWDRMETDLNRRERRGVIKYSVFSFQIGGGGSVC